MLLSCLSVQCVSMAPTQTAEMAEAGTLPASLEPRQVLGNTYKLPPSAARGVRGAAAERVEGEAASASGSRSGRQRAHCAKCASGFSLAGCKGQLGGVPALLCAKCCLAWQAEDPARRCIKSHRPPAEGTGV